MDTLVLPGDVELPPASRPRASQSLAVVGPDVPLQEEA